MELNEDTDRYRVQRDADILIETVAVTIRDAFAHEIKLHLMGWIGY